MEQRRISDFDPENEDSRAQDDDWSFIGADTSYMTHGLHAYPARMIPQIAHRLIVRYSKEGDTVWDPFCGSGSVLVESVLSSRKSIGTDLNPFATFLSRVKTTPVETESLRNAARAILNRVHSSTRNENLRESIPRMPNIDYWFSSDVQLDLAAIMKEIVKEKDQDIQNFMKLCFAATAREVSNLKKREFKIVRMRAEEFAGFAPDTVKTFEAKLKKSIPLMDEFVKALPPRVHLPEIYEVDNRHSSIASDSIDLIVTSPPYGDHGTTVAYGQFSRYPALWIGLDYDSVKTVDRRGLGGTNSKSIENDKILSETLTKTYEDVQKRSKKRAKQLFNFVFDLNESLTAIYDKLRVDGHACIVIGNRLMSRVRIPTDRIVVDLGTNLGLRHIETIPRKIPTKRMPWQTSPENIEGEIADTMHNENIVILQKD